MNPYLASTYVLLFAGISRETGLVVTPYAELVVPSEPMKGG